MGGGIMQIIAYGVPDIFPINPQPMWTTIPTRYKRTLDPNPLEALQNYKPVPAPALQNYKNNEGKK